MASADAILSPVVVDKISLEECRACFDAAANSIESGISAFTIIIFAMSVPPMLAHTLDLENPQ